MIKTIFRSTKSTSITVGRLLLGNEKLFKLLSSYDLPSEPRYSGQKGRWPSSTVCLPFFLAKGVRITCEVFVHFFICLFVSFGRGKEVIE